MHISNKHRAVRRSLPSPFGLRHGQEERVNGVIIDNNISFD